MAKQVRPGPGRRSYLHVACGAACWHHRHRRAEAIKRQAYAFELRFGLGMSAQAHDGTKPMQHACRPAKATQEAERRQLLHGFLRPGHASLLLSVDPSFAFRALAHTDTSHGTAADRSPSPSGHRCLRHDWGTSGKQTWIRREKKGMEGLTRGPLKSRAGNETTTRR